MGSKRPSGYPIHQVPEDLTWVCDCLTLGLTPAPNHIGECQVCYRPVYDDAGVRVCLSS